MMFCYFFFLVVFFAARFLTAVVKPPMRPILTAAKWFALAFR
jgi:hypothetical protein